MILKYQKATDEYTTYALVEPDHVDGAPRATELCVIGDETYAHIPDDMVLPQQPANLEVGMETIVLTDELRAELKALSPHVRLINTRVVEKIREKYTTDDELKMHREFAQNGSTPTTQAYMDHVAASRVWGVAEKAKIGL